MIEIHRTVSADKEAQEEKDADRWAHDSADDATADAAVDAADARERGCCACQCWVEGYHPFHVVANNGWFDALSIVFIIANSLTMAMEGFNASPDLKEFVAACEIFFTFIFLVELLIRLLGNGFGALFRPDEHWLRFDLAIVTGSVISFVIKLIGAADVGVLLLLRLARILRVSRIMRIVRRSAGLRLLFATAFGHLRLLFQLVVFIGVTMICFSLLLKGVLGGKMGQMGTDPVRRNFTTFGDAVLTSFVVMSGEDWPDVMEGALNSQSPTLGPIVLVLWLVLGKFILTELFVAVIISSFQDSDDNIAANCKREVAYFKSLNILAAFAEQGNAVLDSKGGSDGATSFVAAGLILARNPALHERLVAFYASMRELIEQAYTDRLNGTTSRKVLQSMDRMVMHEVAWRIQRLFESDKVQEVLHEREEKALGAEEHGLGHVCEGVTECTVCLKPLASGAKRSFHTAGVRDLASARSHRSASTYVHLFGVLYGEMKRTR